MSPKNLVIVESPAKAKTIEKYLGSDWQVKSSFGHIRDLKKREKGKPAKEKLLVEGVTTDFEPLYQNSPEKLKVIRELKTAAKGKEVWLAADEDREGEAIAWHVCEALGLDSKKTKRIVFHEITKKAILHAVKNPRVVNQDLVDAQQARRVLDRIVGFKLSPILWTKIAPKLSAGRVQSVAVRLIVEREQEIRQFENSSFFRCSAKTSDTPDAEIKAMNVEEQLKFSQENFTAELSDKEKTAWTVKKFDDAKEMEEILKNLIEAEFSVEKINKKKGKKIAGAPFTTSTLQQAASTRMGFSVKRTMMAAQKLYEAGKITYMRTDSVNLSQDALADAEKNITKNYGENYACKRVFKTKSSNAQEAHEAIRPTDFSTEKAGNTSDENKVYDLIWRRAMASQMSDAEVDKTEVIIDIDKLSREKFVTKGEVITFDGWLKVYPESSKDVILPEMTEGEKINFKIITGQESFTRPPARYTEASLVKKLEAEGIGRPSTYAPTISTIQDRGYIDKSMIPAKKRKVHTFTLQAGEIISQENLENYGACNGKLIPTSIGETVTGFLIKYFTDIMEYKFTAKVENEFDEIAQGKVAWKKMLEQFYKGFAEFISAVEGVDKSEVMTTRELGVDPKSKKPVFARIGRFGPMIQIGTKEDEEKPQFTSIPAGKNVEEITLKEALDLFSAEQDNVLG